MKYIYPAIFTIEENGYSINFPDVKNCYTDGSNLQQAIDNAKDVLCLMLYELEASGQVVPSASDITSLNVESGQFATLISCDTEEYKKFFENKAVKKTLTIPFRLNQEAEKRHINFSQVLQEALKQQLGL